MSSIQEKDKKYADSLTDEQVLALMRDSILNDEPIEVADGCTVEEPTAACQHGHRSPLRVLGLL